MTDQMPKPDSPQPVAEPKSAANTEPVVALADATRHYRAQRSQVTAVDRASLHVQAGEIVGIAGPSGCGKSTLLRLLAGVECPDHGDLRYEGQVAWPTRRRGPFATYPKSGYVMVVSQDPFASVDPRWPIWRTATEPLAVRDPRPSRNQRRQHAQHWLEEVGLPEISLDARPHELSGGQCQRVALVRALAAKPSLIVADEPTARQDVITAGSIARLLRKAASLGIAMVVVSHDADWLSTLADRILLMSNGCLGLGDQLTR